MSKPTRRLGRGLDSLVSDLRGQTLEALNQNASVSFGRQPAADLNGASLLDVREVPVGQLEPNPYQPRSVTFTEHILSLADSIRGSGLLQPISVRRVPGGRFQVIAGERRWRAAESIGMTHIPVVLRDATDEQMLELALIENIQREDLNAIERARAYRQFCARFALKPEDVASRLGEDRTTVVNYLRLLDLSEGIQTMVADHRLSMGHARCLLGIADSSRQHRLAETVVENELSVRALEEIVRREKTRQAGEQRDESEQPVPRSAHLRDLQRRFEEAVKTKVTIREGRRKGTGRIVIEFYSLDDFDRIAGMMGVSAE